MGTVDVKCIGQDTVERLRYHRKVPGVLNKLQSRRMETKVVGHVQVQSQPREAPEALNPVPETTQTQHLSGTHLGKALALPFFEPASVQAILRQNLQFLGAAA